MIKIVFAFEFVVLPKLLIGRNGFVNEIEE